MVPKLFCDEGEQTNRERYAYVERISECSLKKCVKACLRHCLLQSAGGDRKSRGLSVSTPLYQLPSSRTYP
eukprot:2941257-Pleurochrysis_carterae.AAC.1